MKKVIITGASGFIGKSLIMELLKNEVQIYAIVRDKNNIKELKDNNNINIIEADFTEYNNLHNLIDDDIDVFYHFAWDGTYGSKLNDVELQLENVKKSYIALEEAIKMQCKKFIMAGTINELEIRGYLEKEFFEPRMACIYGISKLAFELIGKTVAFHNNIEFCTAIIGSVFGPGDKSKMIQNILIEKFLNGESPRLVEGNYLYDWIYIDDAVSQLIAVGEKGINFKNYYIGHNQLKTFKEIILEVRDIINPKLPIKFGDIKDTSIIDYSKININSVYEDTGVLPSCDFRESILKTAEWVKNLNI
ncbi:MAG: NAD(P)-dependent oxidoreductase [Clostridium butyricum]|nr:NAD(P)-dependent oxidoreductase [Clostridium butyricum]